MPHDLDNECEDTLAAAAKADLFQHQTEQSRFDAALRARQAFILDQFEQTVLSLLDTTLKHEVNTNAYFAYALIARMQKVAKGTASDLFFQVERQIAALDKSSPSFLTEIPVLAQSAFEMGDFVCTAHEQLHRHCLAIQAAIEQKPDNVLLFKRPAEKTVQ